MKVLIIEDEHFSAERLKTLLSKIDRTIEVLTVLTSVSESLDWFVENESPDLILLDIHLEDKNSFEIFKSADIQTPVIFTTAYDQYAVKAFKQNSVDYLLKPIVKEELEVAIEKFKRTHPIATPSDEQLKKRFLVRKGSKMVSVPTSEIAFFKSENKLCFLVTRANERFVVDGALEQIITKLDPQEFYKINRQMIVSIQSVLEMGKPINGRVELKIIPEDSQDVFVSRDRVFGFKLWLDS